MIESTSDLQRLDSMPIQIRDRAASDGPGRILQGVFESLDRAGIRACVLHGYKDFPECITSDVDAVIDRSVTPRQLLGVLRQNSGRIGARVVRARGHHLILAGRNSDGSHCFLELDFTHDCIVDAVPLYRGEEILASRGRHGEFWIPAPRVEFACYLARSVAKSCLDEERFETLSRLYGQDPAGCAGEVNRLWSAEHAALLVRAAGSGAWAAATAGIAALRTDLRRRAIGRHPLRFAAERVRGQFGRVRRLPRPDGVYLVLLGPDGAGKSSVIEALGRDLAGVFSRAIDYGFAPAAIHRLRHGPYRPNDAPHALPPRSVPVSVARALLYWLPYYSIGYLWRHLDLARSSLVLYDRHFVDVLVDPKRYRYSGPQWLVRLIWAVIPKPDLIVALDAPPEVLQSRKQEVPFEESARQREAYAALARSTPRGRVVDASQSREQVAADVSAIILEYLAIRCVARWPGAVLTPVRETGPTLDGPAVLPLRPEI